VTNLKKAKANNLDSENIGLIEERVSTVKEEITSIMEGLK